MVTASNLRRLERIEQRMGGVGAECEAYDAFMTNLIEARMQVAVLQEALWEKDLEETKRAELEDAIKKAKAVSEELRAHPVYRPANYRVDTTVIEKLIRERQLQREREMMEWPDESWKKCGRHVCCR